TVYVVLPPASTVCVVGLTAIVKLATLSVTWAVCASVPFVPVMVSVELAAGVVPEVVIVRVVVPAPVIVDGLNVAVAPAGKPLIVGVTVALNALSAPALTVYVVLAPTSTCCVAGVAAMVKSCTRRVA